MNRKRKFGNLCISELRSTCPFIPSSNVHVPGASSVRQWTGKEGEKQRIKFSCTHIPLHLRLRLMSATTARRFPARGVCTESSLCDCTDFLFGSTYCREPENATDACNCSHPWWMHVVIHPASTDRGGCSSTRCGGYYSNVISLYFQKN